ncbi:MAG: hypothetical protein NVS2B3_15140 [Vulcanimicrobiaceae bacterium]
MGTLTTRNCSIHFIDNEDGTFRAGAIAQTCESDIERLGKLFRIVFDVDGLNHGGIRVYIISPPGGGASNPGWGGPLSPSDMDINGDYAPARVNAQTPIVRAEFARFLFVAELAEIMMGVVAGNRWNAGSSEGEALSILLATELHPMGYYGGAVGDAPRVNTWLQSSRPDWLSRTEPTDKNKLSYGCGILFLNYLRHQLGFDLASIIATRPPFDLATLGGKLADRYAELTGKAATQAYPEFTALLERHLPAATAAQQSVGRDDIFPLQPPENRSVFLSTQNVQISSSRHEPPSRVTLKPGILCGEREYQYWQVDEVTQLTATASCSGFAAAKFEWSIHGIKLAPTTASQLSLEFTTGVSVPQPNRTIVEQPAATVKVDYVIQTAWNRSTLLVRNDGNDGIEHLDLHVSATENFFADSSVGSDGSADLSTLHYEYARNFYDDQQLCNGDLVQMSADLAKLSHQMELLAVAPDPQPDARVASVLDAASAINARIAVAAQNMGETGQVFLQEMARGSHVTAAVVAARSSVLEAQPTVARAPEQT